MINRIALVSAIVLTLTAAGCATQAHKQASELKRIQRAPQIVLMPLDVELTEISAGGLQELHAEWTKLAHENIASALASEAQVRNLSLLSFSSGHGTPEDRETSRELLKLHRAVGSSILIHQYLLGFKLPSKQGRFDWSLGPAAQSIARSHDADYAMFIYLRDSYVSAGRAAVIVISALLGVPIPGGTQIGFASLVDLQTGDIVWFNRLVRGAGDLRTPEPAVETVRVLLTDVPK